jgi:hypothetical protein
LFPAYFNVLFRIAYGNNLLKTRGYMIRLVVEVRELINGVVWKERVQLALA